MIDLILFSSFRDHLQELSLAIANMFSSRLANNPEMMAALLLALLLLESSHGFSSKPPKPVLSNNDRNRLGFCRGCTALYAKEIDFEEAAFDPLNGNSQSADDNINSAPRKFYKSSKIVLCARFSRAGARPPHEN